MANLTKYLQINTFCKGLIVLSSFVILQGNV